MPQSEQMLEVTLHFVKRSAALRVVAEVIASHVP